LISERINMCIRCKWVNLSNKLYVEYHDREWGIPVHDDIRLFEMLVLEGAQAGLSWETVLKKRDNYRKAFDGFDPEKIVKYDDKKKEELLQNPGIIRNRLKIKSVIKNAESFIRIQEDFGSFDAFIWQFVNNKPLDNGYKKLEEIPSKNNISDSISKELKKRGMSFVGSTIIYAFMQAVGIVNDHCTDCFRYDKIKKQNQK